MALTKEQHLLIKLSEECSEVIKEISKALIFGIENQNPDVILGEALITNKERITKELADVIGTMETLFINKILERPDILAKQENSQQLGITKK